MRILAALLCLTFIWHQGCQRKSASTSNSLGIKLIEISKTPCRGQCPSYLIQIDDKLNIQFEGYKHISPQGIRQGKLDPEWWEELVSVLKSSEFESEQNDEISGATDVSVTYWRIVDDSGEKKFAYDSRSNSTLKQLEEKVESWIPRITWQ